MKAVKQELGDKASQVNIITVNLDKVENHPLGAEYKIKAVPTIYFIDKEDVVAEVFTGVLPKDDVIQSLKKLGVQ